MRNIKLILAYDGTNYAGWQRQKNAATIQEVVEKKIQVMTGEHPVLHGAGRTDAGVHALGMAANFHTGAAIPVAGFREGLNSLLPEDVRIVEAHEMFPRFHARIDAKGKVYFYNVTAGPLQLPTERLYSAHIRDRLNLADMRACLSLLTGTHDFSSFEASGSRDLGYKKGRGAVRTIFSAALKEFDTAPQTLRLILSGDGFLRHMVRNIVGTLIEVGLGKLTVSMFAQVLAAKDRTMAGPTAPAKGLFLQEVIY